MALATPPQLDNLLVIKNPVNGALLAELPTHTADDLRAMVERARQAQPAWQALGAKERAKRLRRWADLVWERQADVMRVIRSETGKVDAGALLEVIGVDIVASYYMHRAPRWLKDQARLPLIPFVHRAKVTYKPHGLVGVISPWNYPFILPFMDLLPALFAGNVVIVKPSEVTPLSVKIGVEFMHEAGIPADVIQPLYGDGRIGAELVEHADFIAFTGSTATGRKIARRCGERLVPCTMELGGKDPSIVLNDAKLDMAAAGVVRGAFENAGQVCVSIERVYVEEAIYEPFVAKVLELMPQFKVGSGDGDSYHMGSITNLRELERTEQHIADAVSKGAKVVFGGKRRPDLGPLFFEPTVLVDVTHDMDIMREETFGPTLPIMRVKNAEEAVRLANDSEYGLSASIFSTNYARARELAKRIDSGDVSINRTHISVGTLDMPTGGQRNSGMGRRNGREGLLKYVTAQSILSDNMFAQKPDLRVGDPLSLLALRVMRVIRRYVPFV